MGAPGLPISDFWEPKGLKELRRVLWTPRALDLVRPELYFPNQTLENVYLESTVESIQSFENMFVNMFRDSNPQSPAAKSMYSYLLLYDVWEMKSVLVLTY